MPQISPTLTIAEVDEHVLTTAIGERFTQGPETEVGPGDDAAVLRLSGDGIVMSTDALVHERHFRLSVSSAHDVGRRLAGANFSDVAAMGARPVSLVVAACLPPSTTVGWVLEFADGLASEAERAGACVTGGDVSASDTLVLTGTAVGVLNTQFAVTRSGAQPGDVVAVAGRLGWAEAGLAVISRGFTSPKALTDAHRYPEPPYGAGVAAAQAGATSMIDISDGLVADARRIALASGVAVAIDVDAIVPDPPVRDIAAAFNCDPIEWILSGGDDHALLATFPRGAKIPEPFRVIGYVNDPSESGVGVLVGDEQRDDLIGYRHFGS